MSEVIANVVDQAQKTAGAVAAHGQATFDRAFPPQQRADAGDAIRGWAAENPRLFNFLALNLILTGPPLLAFLLFGVTTLFATLATSLFAALALTLAFTGFCVGLALLVLIPTIIFTTGSAMFLYFWAVVGYWILQRLAERERPVPYARGLYTRVNDTIRVSAPVRVRKENGVGGGMNGTPGNVFAGLVGGDVKVQVQ